MGPVRQNPIQRTVKGKEPSDGICIQLSLPLMMRPVPLYVEVGWLIQMRTRSVADAAHKSHQSTTKIRLMVELATSSVTGVTLRASASEQIANTSLSFLVWFRV